MKTIFEHGAHSTLCNKKEEIYSSYYINLASNINYNDDDYNGVNSAESITVVAETQTQIVEAILRILMYVTEHLRLQNKRCCRP